MKEGICAKIVDDIYVGGSNQTEAALNYIRILSKLNNANMKISPDKTHIFPNSVDVLGWVWKRGGFLAPSPHRQCALSNVKEEDIKKVKDMRYQRYICLDPRFIAKIPRSQKPCKKYESALPTKS